MNRARKLLFACLPLLLLVLFAEIVLRVLGYRYDSYFQQAFWWTRLSAQPIYQRDPHLFWRLRPHANSDLNPEVRDTQSINSRGFRDDEFDKKKPAGELRIITLGDSCTFGDGVANWESYANVLEELIAKADPSRPVQVINAGVPGYTSYQVRRYLTGELLAYEPDAVIVYVGFNDNVPATNGVTDAQRSVVDGTAYAFQEVLGKLRTYQLSKYFLLRIKNSLLPDVHPEASNPDGVQHHIFRVPEDEFMENLRAIKALGEREGFRTIVVTLPHKFDAEPERNRLIRRAVEAGDIPVVDLFPIMKVHQEGGESLYGSDGGHPNTLGHRRIAEALLDKLVAMAVVRSNP
ncbi:MAG: SGNH/GDSL hydrolase family protein [Candidatus Lernaella stagnicola]|nr:SGNH/GDSL hydrolase family protein [Candidatus Lernaella stagnicola]